MSVGVQEAERCLSQWTLNDVAFAVGQGPERVFGLPANDEQFNNEICVGGSAPKIPMNYMKRMRRLAVKLSIPETLKLSNGDRGSIELVDYAKVDQGVGPQGASVEEGLTAIARGKLIPSFCDINATNVIRYFLKFRVGKDSKDNTWLNGEDRTYDCDVFNFKLPFFVAPLRIGDFQTPKKLGSHKAGKYHGIMLEDCSMKNEEELFPGNDKIQVNTLLNLMNFYRQKKINGTFIDGFVVQMFSALENMTKKRRCHGDLHWYNMFVTPIKHLYMNETNSVMNFEIK